MRLPVLAIFFTLLVSASAIHAQQAQEDPRMAQILRQDPNKKSYNTDKTFYSGKNGDVFSKSASTKPYYLSNFFSSKKFDAKSYTAGNYWTGAYTDTGKKATTKGKYTVENASKKADVKTMEVKEAPEAGKTKAVQDYAYNHDIVFPGKSQKILDQQQESEKSLTVDQVRELLNKSQ